ncbi:hypothetical protein D3C86_2066800 [compost metagenome]
MSSAGPRHKIDIQSQSVDGSKAFGTPEHPNKKTDSFFVQQKAEEKSAGEASRTHYSSTQTP